MRKSISVPAVILCNAILRMVFFVALLGATTGVVVADQRHHKSRGPAFGNPNELARGLPADWQRRPIKYLETHKGADLVLALGQQSHPIFKDLIAGYAEKNKLKIIVKQGTCGITAGRLLRKTVDVGAFCCPPGKTDRLPGLEFHSLGISPIALIVHPDNPLTNVSTEQARRIFRGLASKWSQVLPKGRHGFNRLIQPIGRLHCKVRPGHWRLLLRNEDMFSPKLYEVGVIPDMISQVARNPRAIGYEVPLMVQVHRAKGKVRMLNIDGHKPTDSVYMLAGHYPLYRSYSLTTWKAKNKKNRLAKKLVRYLQAYIEQHYKEIGYIPPSQLKKAGWKFRGQELIGEPAKSKKY